MFGDLFNREKVFCPYCLEKTGGLHPVELVVLGGEIVKNEKGDHVHSCTNCDEEVPYRYRITNEYLTLILVIAIGNEKMMEAATQFRQLLDYAEEHKEEEVAALQKRIKEGKHRPGEVLTAMMTGNMPKDLPKRDPAEYEQEGIFWKKKEPKD